MVASPKSAHLLLSTLQHSLPPSPPQILGQGASSTPHAKVARAWKTTLPSYVEPTATQSPIKLQGYHASEDHQSHSSPLKNLQNMLRLINVDGVVGRWTYVMTCATHQFHQDALIAWRCTSTASEVAAKNASKHNHQAIWMGYVDR